MSLYWEKFKDEPQHCNKCDKMTPEVFCLVARATNSDLALCLKCAKTLINGGFRHELPVPK